MPPEGRRITVARKSEALRAQATMLRRESLRLRRDAAQLRLWRVRHPVLKDQRTA